IGFVQNEFTLDQNRYLAVRVHHGNIFGLVIQVDIANLEVHAFFKQHKTTALRERTSGSRVEYHHSMWIPVVKKQKSLSFKQKRRPALKQSRRAQRIAT